MKAVGRFIALVATLVSFSAHGALTTYAISDAENKHGIPLGYGLYTFGKNDTGEAKYSIQPNSFFVIDDVANTATFQGTASNGTHTAVFDIMLSGFQETHSYKREGGKEYIPAIHDLPGVLAAPGNGDIDFFSSILGTITIDGEIFDVQQCIDCPNTNTPFGFQFGDGANAKNPNDFGASAWIGVGPNFNMKSHWDFNVKLTKVPEPATAAMLLTGLAVAGLRRRRLARSNQLSSV